VRFILASASPARLATLRSAGVEPEVIVSGVDEDAITAGSPALLVQALANAKATAVLAGLQQRSGTLLLGCDSLLEIDGVPYGKPHTADEAIRRWHRMRGRSGVLHTGHALIDASTGDRLSRTGSTEVYFADVSDAEIEHYVASAEPLRVAGAFTLDGLGGWYVEGVHGDHHNVVGLSLPLLRRMLGELGYAVADLPGVSR
jgi:septum formation protein